MTHFAVVDLGFGDAGKGTVVDWLCANESVSAVIRFNGGAQAGHNVVTPHGRHHTFSQFGSGTFQGVPTFLSRFMIVDPLALSAEAAALGDPYELLTVDPDALLATPWHRAANRKRETLRGRGRHGSCGLGVGEVAAFSLVPGSEPPRVADARAPGRLRARLRALRDHLTDELGPLDGPPIDDFVDVMRDFASVVSISDRLPLDGPCVFEGAQGVLLDEWRGFHPYTTWSTTTFDNVLELTTDIVRLGVVRTYTTRHGPGPFVTEDASLSFVEPHNDTGPWQGSFRLGHFDAVAHRYAIEVCRGVDALAVTHCDVAVCAYCDSYDTMDRIEPGPFQDLDYQERLTRKLIAARPVLTPGPPPIGQLLGAPVLVESHGPRTNEKKRL
ncbi:MAG TPA: adenylosuccinate synthetase [Candidatus Limnocylindrales bacterium]|nr:adenylosuccinate synthetase [Candidatus Limnocylindrales bacterium]